MPAAPNIASRIVTGTYHTPDGAGLPATGTLRFIPSNTVQDVTGHVLVTRFPLEVDLDADGHFSIVLSVTDDPDAQPQDWTWHLTELFPGGREVDFFLPSTTTPTVDISTILPASDVTTFYQYATIQVVDAALATLAATDLELRADIDAQDAALRADMVALIHELDVRMNTVVPLAVRIHPFLMWVRD